MKGYKVTLPDNTCRGFKFEVGKTYSIDGEIKICRNGFHFCEKATSCFNYYSFDPNNKVFEVNALGDLDHDGDKSCTSVIEIVRELTWQEVLVLVNSGTNNTGRDNSGNRNSGDRNSGDRNSGDRNSGDRNSGNWNSGDRNSGDSNSGNWNSGNWNSGDSNSGNRNSGYSNSGNWNSGNWNSGDRNSGDSNSGYRNSGAFCLDNNPKLILFDKPSKMTVLEWEQTECYRVMSKLLDPNIWVPSSNMTEDEKKKFPTHETTGGYLKKKSHYDMWADMWHNLTSEKKNLFTSLENFDADKFKNITGIDVSK